MKNDRKEIYTYHEGMPAVFEKYGQKGMEKGLKLIPSNVGVRKAICEIATGERFLMKYSNNSEEAVFANVLPAIEKQKLPFRVLQLPELLSVVRKS